MVPSTDIVARSDWGNSTHPAHSTRMDTICYRGQMLLTVVLPRFFLWQLADSV